MHGLQQGIRRGLRAAVATGAVACMGAARAGAVSQFDVPFAPYALNLSPAAMTVADLNGDGWQDWILCGAGTRFVEIFAGTPGGAFDPRPVRVAWTGDDLVGATALHVADTDGDGIQDIVISGSGVGRLRGRGDFRFDFDPFLPALRGVYVPGSVLGDLDGDGDLDLELTTYAGSSKVETWRGDHSGGLFVWMGPEFARRRIRKAVLCQP